MQAQRIQSGAQLGSNLQGGVLGQDPASNLKRNTGTTCERLFLSSGPDSSKDRTAAGADIKFPFQRMYALTLSVSHTVLSHW